MSIVGIDLGTTNSSISCFRNGKSELIPNIHGDRLTPSVVSVLDNGEIVVGKAAKERLYTHPQLTAAAFKRHMGMKKKYNLGSHVFTPVELSSLVLKSLKADAEDALGEPVKEAVISVPAYFNEHQRFATKQAGELAGLHVERLISEPSAAALAYGLHESDSFIQFLVFDLGGGTFDVSIVEMFDKVMEVKAVAGDSFLGGEDFDQVIADYFIKDQDLHSRLDNKVRAIIKEKAEAAKFALSKNDVVEMKVVLGDETFKSVLTQEKLEELCAPLLGRIRQPLIRALRDATLSSSDLAYVILVGGSCHMPLIRSYATSLFGNLPIGSIDPDEAVGLGTGVAAALKDRNENLQEHLMTDVCPFTLGTGTSSECNDGSMLHNIFLPIIERNTVIPFSKVVRFFTLFNNQTQVRVTVYQGESRHADQNLKLGEMEIRVPPKPKGEAAIDVRYTYDVNGLLEVEVTSIDTGITERKVIKNAETQLSSKEIDASFKRLAKLKIHPRDKDENRLLLARAERLFEESLGDMRVCIDQSTRDFERVLDRQIPTEIEVAAIEFEFFLNQFEATL